MWKKKFKTGFLQRTSGYFTMYHNVLQRSSLQFILYCLSGRLQYCTYVETFFYNIESTRDSSSQVALTCTSIKEQFLHLSSLWELEDVKVKLIHCRQINYRRTTKERERNSPAGRLERSLTVIIFLKHWLLQFP